MLKNSNIDNQNFEQEVWYEFIREFANKTKKQNKTKRQMMLYK